MFAETHDWGNHCRHYFFKPCLVSSSKLMWSKFGENWRDSYEIRLDLLNWTINRSEYFRRFAARNAHIHYATLFKLHCLSSFNLPIILKASSSQNTLEEIQSNPKHKEFIRHIMGCRELYCGRMGKAVYKTKALLEHTKYPVGWGTNVLFSTEIELNTVLTQARMYIHVLSNFSEKRWEEKALGIGPSTIQALSLLW